MDKSAILSESVIFPKGPKIRMPISQGTHGLICLLSTVSLIAQ